MGTTKTHIALLSCDDAKYVALAGDELFVKELQKETHYEVQTLSWNHDHEWSAFDVVIVRTTWDYMKSPTHFLETLKTINLKTRLFNSYETIKWNIHKFYLKDLQSKGVLIPPTLFVKKNESISLPPDWDDDELIIKPAISAGSYKTHKLKRSDMQNDEIKELNRTHDILIQPFLKQIHEGEYSLIFFNKTFSHAILKTPKTNEFRVQEDFGGSVKPINPNPELLRVAQNIINLVDEDLLYARVDLIPFEDSYALMELELIEPSLYFKHDLESPYKFKKALIQTLSSENDL